MLGLGLAGDGSVVFRNRILPRTVVGGLSCPHPLLRWSAMTVALPAPSPTEADRRVRESYDRQPFLREVLEASLDVVGLGFVEISWRFSRRFTQQNGFVHAGVLTTLADTACGYAALSVARPDQDVLAAEFKINLLRPATAPWFVAQGRVVRAGRTVITARGRVFGCPMPGGRRDAEASQPEPDGVLVASFLSTIVTRPLNLPDVTDRGAG